MGLQQRFVLFVIGLSWVFTLYTFGRLATIVVTMPDRLPTVGNHGGVSAATDDDGTTTSDDAGTQLTKARKLFVSKESSIRTKLKKLQQDYAELKTAAATTAREQRELARKYKHYEAGEDPPQGEEGDEGSGRRRSHGRGRHHGERESSAKAAVETPLVTAIRQLLPRGWARQLSLGRESTELGDSFDMLAGEGVADRLAAYDAVDPAGIDDTAEAEDKRASRQTHFAYLRNAADKVAYQLRNFAPQVAQFPTPQFNPAPWSVDITEGRHGKRGNIIIGMSSVNRKKKNYLLSTVRSIIKALTEEEKKHCKLVILNGNSPATDHKDIPRVEQEFREDINSGFIRIVQHPNAANGGHPELLPGAKPLATRWGDALQRVKWRSKQVLDVALLMEECYQVGRAGQYDYTLLMEDDIASSSNFITKIRKWVDEKLSHRTDWTTASFYNPWPVRDLEELPAYKFFGVIGQLMRTHDLPVMVEFLRKNFDQSPLDWLFVDFLKKFHGKIVVHTPSYFQHKGFDSSFAGKHQGSQAVDFEP